MLEAEYYDIEFFNSGDIFVLVNFSCVCARSDIPLYLCVC